MKNYYLHLSILLLVLFIAPLKAQPFQCTDCPVNILDIQTVESTLNVSGLTNSELNTGSQSICEVAIDFEHTWIPDITMVLIAPNGSSIFLIQDDNGGPTDDSPFDITWLPCDCPVTPDPGASEVFNSDDFSSDNSYNGSYYPGDGCFSDLTGSANGDWILQVNDLVFADIGVINDWSITFCDSGTPACSSLACEADLGDFSVQLYTVCDTDNTIELDPTVTGGQTSTDYATTWVISNNEGGFPGNIIEYSETADLTGFAGGSYFICPINYLLADESLLPAANAGNDYSDLEDLIIDGTICAELTEFDCSLVFIDECGCTAEAGNINISDLQYCEGESIVLDPTVNDQNTDPEYGYTFTISNFESGSIGTLVGYSDNADLTGFAVGQYWVCGLSYLLEDEALLPIADGTNSTFDLQADIADGNICAELAAGCYVIDIQPAAEFPILEFDDVACVGESSTVTITNFDPDAPYTILTNSGSFSIFLVNLPTITFTPFSAVDIELCVTESSICGALETCIDIAVFGSSSDDITITGETETCPDNLLNYTLTGIDNSTVDGWTISGDGSIVGSSTGDNVDVQIDAIPTTGSVELCADVTDDCGTTEECLTINIIDNQLTNSTFPDYCELNFDISVQVNNAVGSGTWSVINSPGPVDFDDINSSFTSVTVSANGDYNLLFTSDCGESIAVDFTVWDALIADNVVVNCIGEEYTITFDISGGESPYTVNSVPVTGNTFTSGVISDDPYFFTISDNIACIDFVLTGDPDCSCDSDAGSISPQDLLVSCEGETITATTDGNQFLDGDDTGIWILYSDQSDPLNSILLENTTGNFSFVAPLDYMITYFVAYVVGNDVGGTVDLADPCIDIAEGTSIIFSEPFGLTGITVDPLNSCGSEFELTAIQDSPIAGNWGFTTIPAGGNGTFSTINGLSTTVTLDGDGSYTVEYSTADGICIATTDVIILGPEVPMVTLISTNCSSDNATYQVNLNVSGGVGPYSIDGTTFSGTTFISDDILSGDDYSFVFTDSNGCESEAFTGSFFCECESQAGNMPADLIEICGDDATTSVNDGTENLDGNDGLVYILHTSSNNTVGTILDENQTGTFSFLPNMTYGETYYISAAVANANGATIDYTDDCLNVAAGQPVTWHEPIIITSITSDPEIGCDDFTLTVNSTLDIDGEWTVLSSPNNSNVDLSNDSGSPTTVSVDVAGTYTLQYEITNGTCTANNTVSFIKSEAPSINNVTYNCDDANENYQVTFDIEGGVPPYTVNGTPSGSTFTSPFTTNGLSIDYVVIDDSGCESGIFTSNFVCDVECTSDAGDMPQELIEICSNENGGPLSIQVSNDTNETLDQDDIGIYILHEGAQNIIVNPIAESTTGIFENLNSIPFNTTLYISFVVGNEINNSVDISDPCLSVAIGQPFIIYENPEVDLGEEISVCGLSATVDGLVNANAGSILNWEVITTPTDATLSITENTNTNVTVNASEAGTYTIRLLATQQICSASDTIEIEFKPIPNVEVMDDFTSCTSTIELSSTTNAPSGEWSIPSIPDVIFNSADNTTTVDLDTFGVFEIIRTVVLDDCTAADTLEVEIYPPSEFIITGSVCDETNENYTLSYEILGDSYPYTINGQTVTESTTIDLTAVSGTEIDIVVLDNNLCEIYNNTVTRSCECESTLGELTDAVYRVCIQDTLVIDPPTFNLAEGDSLIYVMHEGNNVNIDNIVALSGNGTFVFDPTTMSIALGFIQTSYIVTPVIYNGGEFTLATLDLPCTITTEGNALFWYGPSVTSVPEQTIDICESETITLPITHTGQVPLVANIETSNGQVFTLNFLEEGTQNIEVVVTESMTINIVQVITTVLCENEFEGTTTINLISEPEIELVEDISVCNDPLEGETEVQLSDLIVSEDISGTWTHLGTTVIGTSSFNGTAPGDYEYIYTITNECGTTSESIIITVNDCLQDGCPTEVILPLPEVCAGGSINLNEYVLPDFVDQGFWTLVSGNTSLVLEIPDVTISTEATGASSFFFTLPGLPENCDSIFLDSVIITQPLNAGESIQDVVTYCEGENVEINLFDFIENNDIGGEWSSNDTNEFDAQSGVLNLIDLDTGSYQFEYTVGTSGICPEDVVTVIIDIISGSVQFEISDPTCFGLADGAVEIFTAAGTPFNTNYQIINEDGITIEDQNALAPGSYIFEGEDANGCSIISGFVLDDPIEIFLDLGQDIEIEEGETITIDANTNVVNNEIELFEWLVNQSMIDAPIFENITLNPTGQTQVELTIVDDDGCIVSDDIVLTVLTEPEPEVDVVLANIFNANTSEFGVEAFSKIDVVQTFNIYDRWGNLVFTAEDYNPALANIKWNGDYNGSRAMSGVYVYYLSYITTDGQEENMGGDVTLIR